MDGNQSRYEEICGKKVVAVLKANAYGCGDRQVMQAVLAGGADMIAVSSVDEALMIRQEGYEGPVLILGSADPEDIPVMIEHDISAAAFSAEWVQEAVLKGERPMAHDKLSGTVYMAAEIPPETGQEDR